ncbi:hypothetical protein OS493_017906 [Desmophyllum pertusum]|uniref:Uncharacterized protein n=1 Tax=Desmophyllum pertusum TaxID=174260 RepID=A0A9W9Z078_9CNID|nr:hypothetical protein OS493_017906 [Desmophyllum pertusum]
MCVQINSFGKENVDGQKNLLLPDAGHWKCETEHERNRELSEEHGSLSYKMSIVWMETNIRMTRFYYPTFSSSGPAMKTQAQDKKTKLIFKRHRK